MNSEARQRGVARQRIILLLLIGVSFFPPSVHSQTSQVKAADAATAVAEILDAAEQAMGKEAARASIRSVSLVAVCRGPRGDYETRMISERSGNLSFQQFFPDHKNIAGILDGRGWQLADKGRLEWIDPIETFVLRSHEFPLVALDLEKRFHDFRTIGRAQFQGQETTQIAMTDQLGHPSSAYFSLTSHLLVGITDTNARAGGPQNITIRFDKWRRTNGVNLVSHVTIFSGSETYVFNFKSLRVNVAEKNAFQIPVTGPR